MACKRSGVRIPIAPLPVQSSKFEQLSLVAAGPSLTCSTPSSLTARHKCAGQWHRHVLRCAQCDLLHRRQAPIIEPLTRRRSGHLFRYRDPAGASLGANGRADGGTAARGSRRTLTITRDPPSHHRLSGSRNWPARLLAAAERLLEATGWQVARLPRCAPSKRVGKGPDTPRPQSR